jgi:protein translocase SEC61 complex gamma subunit
MGLRSTLKSYASTLRLTKKTTYAEFKLYLKLVLLGMGVVGGIGFIIKVIASFITLGKM